jgi:peptide/nickel transport system substrate-binding protein
MDTAQEAIAARTMGRRHLLRSAGMVGAAVALSGEVAVGQAFASGSGRAADALDTVTWSFNGAAQDLDPMKAGDLCSEAAISSSAQGLVVYDAKGVIRPYLAESWTHPDPKTYVFKIRQGVKFWDGSTMTMDDVLYWLDRIMHNPKSIFPSYFADVASVKATGDMELTIRLKTANPTFLGLAVFLFVGQKAYTTAHDADLGTPAALGMFTGPYVLKQYTPQESVTLERFDGYWGAKPAAKTVVFKFIPNDDTRRLALQSGQLDGGFNVPPDAVKQWSGISGTNVVSKPNLQFGYVSMDTKQAPWNDVHVRRAVAHAVDRVGIVKSIMRGNATVATSYPPPQDWSALLSESAVKSMYASMPQFPFSIAKAKAELAKSSVPNGFKATLPVPASPAYMQQIALSIRANLKQIGIDLTVKQVTDPQYRDAWYTNKKKTGIQMIQNGPTVQDPADFPGIMLTKRYNVSGGFNTANYVNPKIEKLWQVQTVATDPKARLAPIRQALRIASADVPYVPIFWNLGSVAVSDKLSYAGFHAAWYCIQPWAALIKPA